MKRIICLCLLASFIHGCAYRGEMRSGNNRIDEINDLYSRNSIVAAPTYVGNALIIITAYALFWPLDLFPKSVKDSSEKHISGNILTGLVLFGGFIIGTPFLPFSYLCEEDPWVLGHL